MIANGDPLVRFCAKKGLFYTPPAGERVFCHNVIETNFRGRVSWDRLFKQEGGLTLCLGYWI